MSSTAQPPVSVLVVDDDEIMQELMTLLLEAEGHTVTAVGSLTEAKARLQPDSMPGVMLTDLNLPGTDTKMLLETLRQRVKGSQTILLGMSGSEPAAELRTSLDGFLLKPFSTADFHAALNQARSSGRATAQAPLLEKITEPASANEVPVLDMATYLRLAVSMPAAAMPELYRMTLADVQKRAGAAKEAFAGGDNKLCRDEGHAIKGGCGMVGAMELRALGAAIEAGAPVDTSMLNEIDAASTRLRRMLDTLI